MFLPAPFFFSKPERRRSKVSFSRTNVVLYYVKMKKLHRRTNKNVVLSDNILVLGLID